MQRIFGTNQKDLVVKLMRVLVQRPTQFVLTNGEVNALNIMKFCSFLKIFIVLLEFFNFNSKKFE